MMAETLASNGAKVYLCSRDVAACERTAKEIEATALPLRADLSTERGCRDVAAALRERETRLDVLINNSGTSWGEPFETYAEGAWSKCFDLNVKAIFQTTRACKELLQASAFAPARVINVGSVTGITHQPFPTYAYDASKAAAHALTRKLAFELAESEICVNAIAPGYVPTKMTGKIEHAYAKSYEDMAKKVPLGRLGRREDMGGVALFLASEASAWITGAVIPVDGGTLCRPLEI